MSNYATLKSAIQSAVYTNGNGEITGAGLQSVLLQIVNTVGDGYVFKGVATPGTSPGTPDANVFYIGGAGTYSNFGGSYTVPIGSIGVFTYNGSWSRTSVEVVDENVINDVIPSFETDELETMTTKGLYKTSASSSNQYLLIVDNNSYHIVQYRIRYTNGNKWVAEERTYNGATWSAWSSIELASKADVSSVSTNRFTGMVGNGLVDTITEDGVYRTEDGLSSSYLLLVDNKTINDSVQPTQMRIYLNDSLRMVIQSRYKDNGTWTAWRDYTANVQDIVDTAINAINATISVLSEKVTSMSNDIVPILVNGEYWATGGILTHNTYARTNALIDVQAGDILVVKDWILHTSSASGPTAEVYENESLTSVQHLTKADFTLQDGYYTANITASGRLGVNYYSKTIPSGAVPRIQIVGTPVMYNVSDRARHSAEFFSVMYNNSNPFGDASNLYFKDAYKKRMARDCYPLIIIAGQSNANGACPFSDANTPEWFSSANGHMDNYMMWDDIAKRFAPYDIYTNTGCHTSGMGYTPDPDDPKFAFDPFFVHDYLENYGGKVFAIRQAVGGIGIEDQPTTGQRPYTWQPDVSKVVSGCIPMVLELLKKVNEAFAYAESNRINLVPICYLWHQGEHDATSAWAPLYEDNLKNVISWLRGLLAAPCIPLIDGYILQRNSYTEVINAALDSISAADYYCKTVDMTDHMTDKGDGLHFDAQALVYMGQQMYQLYRGLVIGE